MSESTESLVLKAYDLLKFSVPTINRMPRSQKFTVGDRLQNHLSDLLELMIEAYYAPRPDKLPLLRRINLQLEKIRYYYRLGHDLGFYSAAHLGTFAVRVDDIGRRVGGWIKQLDPK